MKCLFSSTKEEFINNAENIFKIKTWNIYDQKIDERIEKIRGNENYNAFKTLASKTKIEHDEEEIVSWLDSMKMMYLIMKEEDNLKDIMITAELSIPFYKNRADYILTKNNKVLIIEFSFNNFKKKQFENKQNQVALYKDLLSNVLNKEAKISTYTFITDANYKNYHDEKHTKKIDNNDEKRENLKRFIKHTFKEENIYSAYEDLKAVSESYEKEKHFKFNDFVSHPIFGAGVVREVEKDYYTIFFNGYGEKTIEKNYEKLVLLGYFIK